MLLAEKQANAEIRRLSFDGFLDFHLNRMERFDYMEQLYKTTIHNKISPAYRRVLIITQMITLLVEMVIFGSLLAISIYFNWYAWIPIVIYVLAGLAFINIIIEIAFLSKFTIQNWRYHVDSEYVRLKNGKFFLNYQIIPRTKIQFVETKQGPVLRKYQLYELSIGTMGSEHTIPGLPEEIALQLREEISQYAKVKEVEQ